MRPHSSGIFRVLLAVLFAVALFPSAALAAADIGKIIALAPGASVQRDGKTETLQLHAGIRVSDTILTDGTGRIKILFNDDTSVSLGPNTSMDMSEYAEQEEDGNAAFGVHVPQGVLRVITGKIVDQNPDGFKITTPEASVGIRGTIVSLRIGQGGTTVYVENTLRQVYVNNVRVPSGNKVILPADPIRPEPIQPSDRRELGRELALRGGPGVAAASPEPGMEGIMPTQRLMPLASGPGLGFPDTPLADIALNTQILGDALTTGPVAPLTASVSGSLSSGAYVGNTFTFGFSVNLSSGAISEGTLTSPSNMVVLGGSSYSGTFNFTGGTGFASSSEWSMSEFVNTGSMLIPPNVAAGSSVFGGANLATVPNGGNVLADYSIFDGSTYLDTGSGEGTLTK